MASHADSFQFVLASALRTLEQVEEDARVAHPAPGRGVALATHVKEMIALVRDRISVAQAAYGRARLPAAQQAVVRNLRLYTQLARALHQALPWLDPQSGSELDLGTNYFIDEAALAIVGKGVETVAVPDTTYMYSTLSWPFRIAALEHLKVDVATGTRPIVLFFPLKEARSVLFHTLFVHELGHSGVDEHDLVDAVLQPIQSDAAFMTNLAAARTYFESVGYDPTTAERLARGRLAGWIEELLCDALALQYLGPSYLFGFTSFVLASSWTDPSPTHPSPTLRVGLLVDQLTSLGWKDWFQDRRPSVWAWLEWAKGIPLPAMSPDHSFARDVALQQAGAIRKAAADQVASRSYVPNDFLSQENELAALLARRIIPAEIGGVAVDRRNIMLAGWLYVLSVKPDGSPRDDEPAALPAALSEQSFQRFLAKALELSTIAETWSGLP